MWKTGGEHANIHESCEWKSYLFHQILISEHISIVMYKN